MAGLTFAQMPDEEAAFLGHLAKTGDIWARAVGDDPHHPAHPPGPVAEFLKQFADVIAKYHKADVYLGFEKDVLEPETSEHEVTEGGTLSPLVQADAVVEGVHSVVGGVKVKRLFVDPNGALIRYKRGLLYEENRLALSNLGYQSRRPEFLKWAKKVVDWMRRRTHEAVPVEGCNYSARATVAAAAAHLQGLRVTV